MTRALLQLGGFPIQAGLLWFVSDQMNEGDYDLREVSTVFIAQHFRTAGNPS